MNSAVVSMIIKGIGETLLMVILSTIFGYVFGLPLGILLYLTDENDKEFEYFNKSIVPTFYDLRLASTNAGGKLIYSGYLKNNGSQKFKLRMWVADTYELTAEKIKFSANLNVGIK